MRIACMALGLLLVACRGAGGDERANAASRDRTRAASVAASAEARASLGATRPCGGQRVLVVFTASSLNATSVNDSVGSLRQIRTLAERVLIPVRDRVTEVDYSPVIRTIRLALRDSASVNVVTAALRSAPDVAEVSLDSCAVRVPQMREQGKP